MTSISAIATQNIWDYFYDQKIKKRSIKAIIIQIFQVFQ